jgi:hypothetical protein
VHRGTARVARVGFEGSQDARIKANGIGSRSESDARADVSTGHRVHPGPSEQRDGGIDQALGKAVAEASAAGRWDVVVQLTRELELRRKAHG